MNRNLIPLVQYNLLIIATAGSVKFTLELPCGTDQPCALSLHLADADIVCRGSIGDASRSNFNNYPTNFGEAIFA